MKRFYLIGCLAALYLRPVVNAQSTNTLVPDPLVQSVSFELERRTRNIDFSTKTSRETIFCNDFLDVNEWTIETTGQGSWEWATETPLLISQTMGEMASASSENGFCLFNGIQWLFNPPVQSQSSTLTYNGIVDCSALDDVIVTFYQMYKAYNADQTLFEVSNDGGSSWIPYLLNENVLTNQPTIQGYTSIDVSAIAAGEADVRFRFRWKSDYLDLYPDASQEEIDNYGSGYMWILDDICFMSTPENDISIGTTWYQNFFEIQEQTDYLDTELIAAAEYHTQPNFSNREFNFACVVTNTGILDQNNVKLIVTVTDPEGNSTLPDELVSAEGLTLTAGASDTLRIYDVMPSVWNNPLPGTYVIDFEVVQDEEDEFPGNNLGTSLFTRITDNDHIMMHSNSNTVNPNTSTTNLEDYAIHANRFSFKEETVTGYAIVGIQFALQDETLAGEQIMLNVRQGSVTEEESEENVMIEYFSYEMDDYALSYITDASQFTNSSTPVWIEYAFYSNPILIEDNKIYQAEIMIPQLGEPYCRVGATTGRTSAIGVFFDFDSPSSGPQGWNAWTSLEYNIRLMVSLYPDLVNVTRQDGVVLTQNYPNPFTNDTRIQYKLEETTTARLEVYDMAGKLVFGDELGLISAGTANIYMFNRGSLASGVYTYSIVTENARVTRKMLIK